MKNENMLVGWIGGLDEMARYCSVSKRTISRWVSDGTLHVRHLSKRRVVAKPADLDRAVEMLSKREELS